jgi:AAA family ATP:ADP antiporter
VRLISEGLERFLSLFATVRRGEGTTAFLLLMNGFVLLTAYYIVKPVREALILSSAGAEVKAYSGAILAVLFIFIIPLYSKIASHVNRVRLINGITGFFISNLVLFYVLGQMKFEIGVPFFLWVGLFNLMLVAQFWAFANDVYTQEQGKRLFAIVGGGAVLGAIFGAKLAGWLFDAIGVHPMMLLTATLLAVSMVLTTVIHRREGASNNSQTANEPIGPAGGFQLVLASRYLLLIALLVLLSNFVNTTGEFILGKTVSEHAKTIGADPKIYIGQFYADFFFWVNLIGAGLQLFVVSRIMKYVGIGAALFVLPVIALGSYALLALAPILSYIRIAKIAENSADYSIQNTARHALFLNTSREAKYKAQSAIESFFWRAGDALSGLLVFIGTGLALSISSFAVINVLFVFIWLGVAAAIVAHGKKEQAPDGAVVERQAA